MRGVFSEEVPKIHFGNTMRKEGDSSISIVSLAVISLRSNNCPDRVYAHTHTHTQCDFQEPFLDYSQRILEHSQVTNAFRRH